MRRPRESVSQSVVSSRLELGLVCPCVWKRLFSVPLFWLLRDSNEGVESKDLAYHTAALVL